MKNHQDEATVGTEAFLSFAQQFGQDDVYNRIIMEELLKAILGVKEDEEKEENGNNE